MRGWLLPVATGLLLASAFPPFNVSQSAWLALVPLVFALEGCAAGQAFRRGYVAGFVFFGATIWWTVYTTVAGAPLLLALAGTMALVSFLALYFGLASVGWMKLSAALDDRKDAVSRNLMLAMVGTAGWVTLEWVRGVFLFGGFPWNFLGVALWQSAPLVQFASVTGVYGVSALVCFVNFALYLTLRRFLRQIREPETKQRPSWEFYAAMALLCAAFLHGWHEIQRGEPRRTLRLAVVQGNIPQTLKFVALQKPMILERYRTLTEAVITNRPDLILWPESATPQPLRYDADSLALVTNLVEQAHTYLLTGTLDATPYSSPIEEFNAAMLLRPDGMISSIYRKIHLVPFGEYVPLRKVFPFVKWLTPIEGSLERGREFTVFELEGRASARPPANDTASQKRGPPNDIVRFATVICFEDTVPDLYRRFVQRGAEFMVNLTNDAWFKTSPAAEMHLANAVFRAVENHRPLVRVTNHGVTCLVDELGVVRERLAPFTEGAANWELSVPRARTQTFYTRFGDVFVAGCGMVTALGIAVALFRRRAPVARFGAPPSSQE